MEFRSTMETAGRSFSINDRIMATNDIPEAKEGKHPLYELMERQIQQNDTIIRQNEQIMRQNDQIIQLLQKRNTGHINEY